MSQGIFAFVAFKPCGCVAQVCTPTALSDSMKSKFFREQMKAGKVKTVATREEWKATPWFCNAHKKPEAANA